jgi:hypothetical protein
MDSSKRDREYLEKLQRIAAGAPGNSGTGPTSEQRLEEMRRWEGQAAVVAASVQRPSRSRSYSRSAPGPAVQAPTPGYFPGVMPNNPLAVLSLIFSFGGGLLGIVFGHTAMYQINRSGERGGGMAVAGLVIGYIWLVVLLVLTIRGAITANDMRNLYY